MKDCQNPLRYTIDEGYKNHAKSTGVVFYILLKLASPLVIESYIVYDTLDYIQC